MCSNTGKSPFLYFLKTIESNTDTYIHNILINMDIHVTCVDTTEMGLGVVSFIHICYIHSNYTIMFYTHTYMQSKTHSHIVTYTHVLTHTHTCTHKYIFT